MSKTRAELETEAAEDYAAAILDGFNRGRWKAYNAILLEQFSMAAFRRIKERAWRLVESRKR